MPTTHETELVMSDVTLKNGDRGNDVKALQVILNYRGAGLNVDGIFGSMTESKVVEFQRAVQLVADGIVGAMTWAALRSGMVKARTAGSTINMRVTPDRTADVVQTLASEEVVTILGRSPVLDESYSWFHLQARQATGWVREDLVQISHPFTNPLPIVNQVTIQSRPRPWLMEIDAKVEAGIRSVFNFGFRDRIRYLFHSLSNTSDVLLVYVIGVSGTGGSTLLVMKASDRGYQVISKIMTVQQPVVVTPKQTFGHPDLVVLTAGGGQPSTYRRLRFDGKTYPTSPTAEPAVPSGSVIQGAAFISQITLELAAPLVAV